LPDRFKISQLTAGLSQALYCAAANSTGGTPAARTHGRRNPDQFTVATTSRICLRISGRDTHNEGEGWGRARSANFGVLAAVQLHKAGVMPARWLGDVGVLAAVQPHDAEAVHRQQLAQVPHAAHARDRDSYGGGEDRAAEQREPAGDVIMDTLVSPSPGIPWNRSSSCTYRPFAAKANPPPPPSGAQFLAVDLTGASSALST
jgi:hypothetical protein